MKKRSTKIYFIACESEEQLPKPPKLPKLGPKTGKTIRPLPAIPTPKIRKFLPESKANDSGTGSSSSGSSNESNSSEVTLIEKSSSSDNSNPSTNPTFKPAPEVVKNHADYQANDNISLKISCRISQSSTCSSHENLMSQLEELEASVLAASRPQFLLGKPKETEIFISNQNLADLKNGSKVIEITPELEIQNQNLSGRPPKPNSTGSTAIRDFRKLPNKVDKSNKPAQPIKSILKQPSLIKSKFKASTNNNSRVTAYQYQIDKSHADMELRNIDDIVQELDQRIEEEQQKISHHHLILPFEMAPKKADNNINGNSIEDDYDDPSTDRTSNAFDQAIERVRSEKVEGPSPQRRTQLTENQINSLVFQKDSKAAAENSLSKAVASDFMYLNNLQEKQDLLNYYHKALEDGSINTCIYKELPRRSNRSSGDSILETTTSETDKDSVQKPTAKSQVRQEVKFYEPAQLLPKRVSKGVVEGETLSKRIEGSFYDNIVCEEEVEVSTKSCKYFLFVFS